MIEFELIPLTKGGQPITRLLIYSKEERLKPSDDVIEDYRKSCSKDWSSAAQSKKSFSNASLRTIESKYALFKIESPFDRKGLKRLESLAQPKEEENLLQKTDASLVLNLWMKYWEWPMKIVWMHQLVKM